MFQLSNEERLAIARRVVEKAAGRVPVVAGGECILRDSCKLRMWLVQATMWLVSNRTLLSTLQEERRVWHR